MIRPSSLPPLAQCPCFVPGESEFQEPGDLRHKALAKLWTGDETLLDRLPEEDADGVRWAKEYISLKAATSDYPIDFERSDSFLTSDFDEIKGTPDVVCGPDLFDLKWRERDYTAQMAAYALMILQKGQFEEITVHLLFAQSQRTQVFKLDLESAIRIVETIIRAAKDPERKPNPCSYCSWCASQLTCSAHIQMAGTAAKGYSDGKLDISSWHPSQVATAEDMAVMLQVAELLQSWVKSVKFHADKMWMKDGMQIPGCTLKESKGKRYVTDLQGVLDATQLPVEKLLPCCTVRFTSSKDSPDKPGLEETYHAHQKEQGITVAKAASKRELNKKIDAYVKRGEPKFHVVTNKSTEEEGEENA
jgi:hypothetical protein